MGLIRILMCLCLMLLSQQGQPVQSQSSRIIGVLNEYIQKNDIKSVDRILSLNADLRYLSNSAEGLATPLVVAINEGREEIVAAFMAHGMDVNVEVDSRPAIVWAVLSQNISIIELFLNHNATLSVTDSHGRSALHYAICQGSIYIVRLLVSHGAGLRQRDACGRTPVHYAAMIGDAAILSILPTITNSLSECAECYSMQDRNGWTPLHYAAALGYDHALEMMLSHLMSNPNALQRQVILDRRTRLGRTALHYAAIGANRKDIGNLLAAGSNAASRDTFGNIANDYVQEYLTSCGGLLRKRGSESQPAVKISSSEETAPLVSLYQFSPLSNWDSEGPLIALWADGVILFNDNNIVPIQGLRVGALSKNQVTIVNDEVIESGIAICESGSPVILDWGGVEVNVNIAAATVSLMTNQRSPKSAREFGPAQLELMTAIHILESVLRRVLPKDQMLINDCSVQDGKFRGVRVRVR